MIKNNKNTVNHGEIALTPYTGELPTNDTNTCKECIVGHSETGHHHVIESTTEFDQIMTHNGMFVRLYEEALLVHKKDYKNHESIVITPGTYKISEKTEYNPFTKLTQRVFD